VLKRVTFPSRLDFVTAFSDNHTPIPYHNGTLPATLAFDSIPGLASQTIGWDLPGFEGAFRKSARQFAVNLPTPDGPYIAVHLRFGDKSALTDGDFSFGCQPHKYFCTRSIVAAIRERLNMPVYVVSENPKLALKYLPGLTPWAGAPTEGTDAVFGDLGILMGAAGIVVHSNDAWSAFSVFASLARDIPMITTWDTRECFDVCTLVDNFCSAGYSNDIWFDFSGVLGFVRAVKSNRSGE